MNKGLNYNDNSLNWKILTYVFGIVFICLLIIVIILIFNKPNIIIDKDIKISDIECSDCIPRYIDGVLVKPEQENIQPIAVVIDNHPDARPPFGISKANLVYEAEAEGRISRYLAIFATDENIEKIGPVRSARPYFIDWLSEYDAVFAHCGGSPEALARILKEGIFDLNEFYNGPLYWRTKDNRAPHNIFTSTENLNSFISDKNLEKPEFSAWSYKQDSPSLNSTSTIKLAYRQPSYNIEWKYEKEDNNYSRYLDGKIHKDGNGDIITAKNIIIQFAKTKVVDEEFRVKIDTIGENKAIVCLDGECKEGIWKKSDLDSHTMFFYNNNEEAELNRGTTWIQVVREGWEVSI